MKYYLENSKNVDFSLKLVEIDNLIKKSKEKLEGKQI